MRTEEQDVLPPHSAEMERAVLGCCLLDPAGAIPEVIRTLASGQEAKRAFYDLRHALLFGELVALHDAGKPMDMVTIRQALADAGKLEQVGGIAYLLSLVDAVPSATMAGQYAEAVAGKWKLRKMQGALVEGLAKIRANGEGLTAEGVLENISADVLDVVRDAGNANGGARLVGDHFAAIMARIDTFVQGRRVMQGLSSGFNYLDNMTCGFKGGEYIVIAARPGQGKTSIVMQFAEHIAVELGKAVAMFSMEMSGESLAERLWFSYAGADFQHYRNGFMEQRDAPRLTTAALKLRRAPIYVDDNCAMNIQRLSLEARKLKREHDIAAVMVDYLQLMPATPGRENDMRARELADISMGFKRLAKELNIPVIVLAQMNRNIEQGDSRNRKPVLSDLKECGQIEQDADVVGFLYAADMRKAEQQWDDTGRRPAEFEWLSRFELPEKEAELMRKRREVPEWTIYNWKKHLRRINLLLAKQRNGPTGDCALVYESARMRFRDAHRPGQEPGAEGEAGEAAEKETEREAMPTREELGL